MASPSRRCCLSQPRPFNNTCSNCKRWWLEGMKIRKSRWNAGVFRFKCDHGPHTEDFYLCTWGNDAIRTPTRRAPPDYKEKGSSEIKVFANSHTAGQCNYEMEVVNFDFLSDVSSSDVTPRGRGRPGKVINHCSNVRFQRWNIY
jgi:hypothetical protein